MTEQQKQVLTAIAGFMLSAAYKIDNTENEKEKSDGVEMIVGGVSQLIERFGLDEDELTAKAGVALILDSVFENFDTENALNLITLGNTSSIRDIKVGGEWKYKFTPQVSLSDQTLIKNRDSGLEEALEFVTRHDVVDMNSFKEVDGGMTIEFIYRKSK